MADEDPKPTASMSGSGLSKEEKFMSECALKFDHFQNIHRLGKDQKKIEGAPNFRQVEGLPVFGTGQPTLESFRGLLTDIKDRGYSRIKWTNMRQEPVIYVNGQSFTPRKADRLNENMEMNVTAEELEALTNAFLSVVNGRAKSSGGKVDYFQDTYAEHPEDRVNIKHTVPLESALSLEGVYEQLRREGFQVSIGRLPIVDEKSPSPEDFDCLVALLKDEPFDTVCVFNCQMGKGRTTTGMVCSCLIKEAIFGEKVEYPPGYDGKKDSVLLDSPDLLRLGNFELVLALLEAVPGAKEAKARLDLFIDLTGPPFGLQNLREAVMWTHEKFVSEPDSKKAYWVHMGRNFIERYAYLIAFASYIRAEAKGGFKEAFATWIQKHGEIIELIAKGVKDFQWK